MIAIAVRPKRSENPTRVGRVERRSTAVLILTLPELIRDGVAPYPVRVAQATHHASGGGRLEHGLTRAMFVPTCARNDWLSGPRTEFQIGIIPILVASGSFFLGVGWWQRLLGADRHAGTARSSDLAGLVDPADPACAHARAAGTVLALTEIDLGPGGAEWSM